MSNLTKAALGIRAQLRAEYSWPVAEWQKRELKAARHGKRPQPKRTPNNYSEESLRMLHDFISSGRGPWDCIVLSTAVLYLHPGPKK